MRNPFHIGLVALALVAAPVAVTSALAQQSSSTGKTAVDYGKIFLGKLAAGLGVDQAKLEAAIKSAGNATVDEALKNQDITRTQADAVKARIQVGDVGRGLFAGPAGARGFAGRDGFGPGGRGMVGGPGMMRGVGGAQAMLEPAAKALGISSTELASQLRSGKTLEDIAKARNVDVKTVQAALLSALKTRLDAAVKAGQITQARADEMYKRAQEDPSFGLRFGRGRR
jgi:hypothetical protein